MKKILFFILLLLISSICFSSLNAKIILYHEQPISIKQGAAPTLTLEVVDGYESIERAWIFYRETGALSYNEKEMQAGSETNPNYIVTLDEIQNYKTDLEYYFLVKNKNRTNFFLPKHEPQLNPFRVSIDLSAQSSSYFIRLAPDREFSQIEAEFVIAISFFAISEKVNKESIKFKFDEKDVTDQSTISSNILVYNVEAAKQGRHTYHISAELINGEKVTSPTWITNVEEKLVQLPLNSHGRATLNLSGYNYDYNVNGDSLDKKEQRANLRLRLDGHHKWFRYKSKLYLSSLEDHNYQPINRFSLALSAPHLQLTLGDKSPQYGSFAVTGKNIRGIHTKLYYKYFRLFTSYGQTDRSIKGGLEDSTYVGGTFQRRTTAFKIEVGSRNGVLWGLGFTKNKDDIKSLNEASYLDLSSEHPEDNPTVTPKDNVVLDSDLSFKFLNQRFIMGLEAAMSLYNSNTIGGALSLQEIEDTLDQDIDIPFDPKEIDHIFVINQNLEPLKLSMANAAYKAYLRAFFYNNLFQFSYAAIGPSFNSLSSNFLQKDARIISFYDNIILWQHQLLFNFGLNLISDNVYDKKDVTTSTTNYFGQILVRPQAYPYFRLNFSNNRADNDDEDSPQDIGTTNFTIGTGYTMENLTYAPTDFSLSFSSNTTKDEEGDSYEYAQNIIALTAKSKFASLPLTTTFSYSLSLNNDSYLDSVQVEEETQYNSLYLKGEMSLLRDKLRPFADIKYTSFAGDIANQSVQMFNLGTSYSLNPDTFLRLEAGLKNYLNRDADDADYSRFNFSLKIDQKF